MPLPENFNPYEHLQDTIKRWYNREVQQHFSDVWDDGDNLTIPRSSLKVACRHEDRDTMEMTLMRIFLFEIAAKHAASLQPAIYGMPVESFESEVVYKPQVKLFFSEPWEDVVDGFHEVEGEITFRLMNETSQTMTMAKAQTLATRIHQVFATPPFIWKKGVEKLVYKDRDKGYNFSILARTEADGKSLIERVLDIQNDIPDWNNLNVVTPQNATARFPYNPGTQTIMGKPVRKRRARPRVDVRFRYASLYIHGLPNPLTLVDTTGYRRDPLVS